MRPCPREAHGCFDGSVTPIRGMVGERWEEHADNTKFIGKVLIVPGNLAQPKGEGKPWENCIDGEN